MKTYDIGGIIYRINPNGAYALYQKAPGVWRESSCVTNEMLETAQEKAK